MIFVCFGGGGKDGESRITFFALVLEPFLPDTHDFRMLSLPLILRKKHNRSENSSKVLLCLAQLIAVLDLS